MQRKRASLVAVLVLMVMSASAFGTYTVNGGGGYVIRPDGTVEWNTGLLVLDGNTVSIYVGGVLLASTVFESGLDNGTVEGQYRGAINTIADYRGPTREDLRQAAAHCNEGGIEEYVPWGRVIAASVLAGQSSTSTIRDASGRVTDVATNETPFGIVKSICIQYGVNCWCVPEPCTCYKFYSVMVTILTPQGPCMFTATKHLTIPIPCS